MRHLIKIFTATILVVIQFSGMTAQNRSESFNEFRKSILDNYNNHRSELLSQYGNYLDSLWVKYPQYAGVERNPFPKPKDIPIAKDIKPDPDNWRPSTPDNNPDVGGTPTHKEPLLSQGKDKITILFYGLPLTMADVQYEIPNNVTRSTASRLWKYMSDDDIGQSVIKEIKRLANELNLNDYLIYELTRQYVDAKFRNHTSFSRYTLTHYLLSNMGYDVRLAETESGFPLILLPFNQMVYARTFLSINNKKYFVFSEKPLNPTESIYTCYLPSDIFLGNSFELKLNGLKLPYKPHKYEIKYGNITLAGEVNGSIYPILYHYPQMPISDYAQSVVNAEMRSDIVSQLKAALKEDSQKDKAEKLLHFTQSAFNYATDDDNHGFEKPYFFEEIVYYSKCDCEDRAIFYSYLLYNVAGIENHIISYPGHEATALTLPSEDLTGTSYNKDGKTFYISDPTYIGASIGMCMPDFENVKPKIDYIYNILDSRSY